MTAAELLWPMAAHIVWVVLLYALLTLVRAPSVWGLFRSSDGGNPWADIERRVSANLSNQFEWPMLFYAVCVLLLQQHSVDAVQLWLAWLFVAGRLLHSIVQIGSANVRLRGIVFTINFVAVLAMWGRLLASAWA